ncbi:MAG: hypothetical protein ABEI52_01260 [Halobacteriaceae archaeon]
MALTKAHIAAATELGATVETHHGSTVRVSNGSDEFGQVKPYNSGQWLAEIRKADAGDLIRYAGIWSSKQDAIHEAAFEIAEPSVREQYLELNQ